MPTALRHRPVTGHLMVRLDALPPNYRLCPKCQEPQNRWASHEHVLNCQAPTPAPQPAAAAERRTGSGRFVGVAAPPPPATGQLDADGGYTFTVPGDPVGYKRVGGAFTDRDGKHRRALPPKIRAHRRLVRDCAKAVLPCMPFDTGPVALRVVAVFRQPKNGRVWPDSRTWSDWDNLGKLVSDSLGYAESDSWGVYGDDGQVVHGAVWKLFGSDPRTIVSVRAVTERDIEPLPGGNPSV